MFTIDQNIKIYLYGAASIGKIVYQNLESKGIITTGFIDKRADEIASFLGRPVLTLSDFLQTETKDTVVVISVKNVFEHDAIAEKFIEKGFCNLIFKPKSVLENRSSVEDKRVGDIYDALLDGTAVDMENISSTTKLAGYYYKDYALVREDSDTCIAMLPVALLYTNDYDPLVHKWGNVNLYSFFTHDDFFRSLAGIATKSSDLYVNEYCVYSALQQKDITITEKWRKNVVANRAMIYEQMCLSLELDPDFFYRNPATACWNKERKYFNLTSGKHRCMFLVSKGYYYIPVRIKKADYHEWCRKEQVDRIWETMQENGYNNYDGIVAHPYFYKYSSVGWAFLVSCVHEMSNIISKEIYSRLNKVDFRGYTIVDQMNGFHSISRYFAHSGASVYRKETNEMDKTIDAIENVSVKVFTQDVKAYDALFLTTESAEDVHALQRKKESLCFILSKAKLDLKVLTKGYISGMYYNLYKL